MLDHRGPRRHRGRQDDKIEDRPLSAEDLARIRDSLAEPKRWPFMLSLDERLFDQVVELTTRKEHHQ